MQAMLTINEANAISEALHKNILFNLKLSVADYKNLSDSHTKLKQVCNTKPHFETKQLIFSSRRKWPSKWPIKALEKLVCCLTQSLWRK